MIRSKQQNAVKRTSEKKNKINISIQESSDTFRFGK